MFQWLGLAHTDEWCSLGFANQLVNPLHHFSVLLLPRQVVFPCLVCENHDRQSSAAQPSNSRLHHAMNIAYRDDAIVSVEAAIDLYKRSTLGERRPVDRPDIFKGMLNNSNLTVTAWDGERLVGIARSLTDFTYVAYLADLAVDVEYQRHGIGRQLIDETKRRLWKECVIVLLAAPKANDYYPKIGFEPNPRAWMLKGD